MSKPVDEAVRSLERAQESARQRLGEIEQERDDLKASLKSLDAALRAVTKHRSLRSSVARPAATTAEVKAVAMELIAEQREIPIERLEELIGSRLHALGKSRSGVKLRLTQALEDERFVETKQGIGFRSTTPEEATPR